MKPKIQNGSPSKPVADRTSDEAPMSDGYESLLDSNEAAQLLRIHPKTLQRMARKREIPAMQIGKLWRFSPAALLAWEQEKLAG